MSMLCTCIMGQMANTFLQSGGKCLPLSITWGQMSLYTIFHRGGGADVRGGGNVLHSLWLWFYMSILSVCHYRTSCTKLTSHRRCLVSVHIVA